MLHTIMFRTELEVVFSRKSHLNLGKGHIFGLLMLQKVAVLFYPLLVWGHCESVNNDLGYKINCKEEIKFV